MSYTCARAIVLATYAGSTRRLRAPTYVCTRTLHTRRTCVRTYTQYTSYTRTACVQSRRLKVGSTHQLSNGRYKMDALLVLDTQSSLHKRHCYYLSKETGQVSSLPILNKCKYDSKTGNPQDGVPKPLSCAVRVRRMSMYSQAQEHSGAYCPICR